MYLAQSVTTEQVADAFGWPAAIVIVTLVIALIFTVRLIITLYAKMDTIRTEQIKAATEVGDKIVTPIESIAGQVKFIYENAVSNSKRRS